MNEQQFREILNVALFYYSGTTEEYMIDCCDFNPENVKIGTKLCKFLQEKVK